MDPAKDSLLIDQSQDSDIWSYSFQKIKRIKFECVAFSVRDVPILKLRIGSLSATATLLIVFIGGRRWKAKATGKALVVVNLK